MAKRLACQTCLSHVCACAVALRARVVVRTRNAAVIRGTADAARVRFGRASAGLSAGPANPRRVPAVPVPASVFRPLAVAGRPPLDRRGGSVQLRPTASALDRCLLARQGGHQLQPSVRTGANVGCGDGVRRGPPVVRGLVGLVVSRAKKQRNRGGAIIVPSP